MSLIRCHVLGCPSNLRRKAFKLPITEPDMCIEWVRRAGNSRFDPNQFGRFYSQFHICNRHFTQECFVPPEYNSRRALKKFVLPTLYLPMIQDSTFQLESNPDSRPSTSTIGNAPVPVYKVAPVSLNDPIPDVPPASENDFIPNVPAISTNDPIPDVTPVPEILKSPPRRNDLKRRKNILLGANVRRIDELPVVGKKLYSYAVGYRKIARRLLKQKTSLQERLRAAEGFSNAEKIMGSKINRTSLNFILGQLKNQPLLPQGRRFSFEEKTFALSILRPVPKGTRCCRNILLYHLVEHSSNY